MADDGDPARVLHQPAGEEVQGDVVQVVGRLVQQQQVRPGAEGDGQAHPVALADRERCEGALAVRARVQPLEVHVHAPAGVPGVVEVGPLQRGGVPVSGAGVVGGLGQGGRGGVQGLECGVRAREGVADQVAHRAGAPVGPRPQRLRDERERARPRHAADVGRDPAREHVEQRGLAAPVLTHDPEPRAGVDPHRGVRELSLIHI